MRDGLVDSDRSDEQSAKCVAGVVLQEFIFQTDSGYGRLRKRTHSIGCVPNCGQEETYADEFTRVTLPEERQIRPRSQRIPAVTKLRREARQMVVIRKQKEKSERESELPGIVPTY